MKTKERIFYYDFLRAFAIIAVILCHVSIFYSSQTSSIQTISKLTVHGIGSIGVPVFLMISGALLLNRNYSLSEFLKKRFSRIIYPYLFWVTLIVLGIFVTQRDYQLMIDVIIGDYSVTWYFWTLIGVYLAIPILNSFLKEYGEDALKYFLIVWIFTIILKTVNHYPLFTYFNLDFFTGYVGFPILGYYLDNKKFNLKNSTVLLISVIVFIVSFVTCVYIRFVGLPMEFVYINFFIVVYSAAFYLAFKVIDNMTSFNSIRNNFIGKAVLSLSACSYGMMFSHVLVLKAFSLVNPHSDMLVPVIIVAMVFCSWLFVFIVSKIPYIKRVSGV